MPREYDIEISSHLDLLRVYHQLCLGFLSNLLVHEFNNSLTSLSGYAQMALAIKREDILVKAAHVFQESSGKLHELVQHISAFAREPLDRFGPADPSQSAVRIQRILDHHLSKRNIAFSVDNRAGHPVVGNPVLLALAVLTFALDARDRLLDEEKGGELAVTVAEAGERIHLVFQDSSRHPSRLVSAEAGRAIGLSSGVDPRQAIAPAAFRAIATVHCGEIRGGALPDRRSVLMDIPAFTNPH